VSTSTRRPGPARAACRRTAPAAVLAALVAALLAPPGPALAQAQAYDNVERVDAGTPAEAAAAISAADLDGATVPAVVLATDENFPDGLTASAVAGAVGAPILFTEPGALTAVTREELARVLASGGTVYVMGGETAISTAVTDELVALGYAVQRLEGATRLETAAAAAGLVGVEDAVIIARAFGPGGAGTVGDRTTGWVDAVSCGPYAHAERLPILLTETERLSDTTRGVLEAEQPSRAIVCGGDAAVSVEVVAELEALGLDVQVVQGVTRVETAVDAARQLFGRDPAQGAYVAVPGYGEAFGFGLAAATYGLPILLVGSQEPTACDDAQQPSRETLCHLQTRPEGEVPTIRVVGDVTAVADAVVEALALAAGGTAVDAATPLAAPEGVVVEDVADDDGTRLAVDWEPVADPDGILAGYDVLVGGAAVDPDGDATTPTTDEASTELVLEDLTPDAEVLVSVAAVDALGRRSVPSAEVAGTPTDEVPEALQDLVATPGDERVVLTWSPGPVDAASYGIERGAPDGEGTCGGYEELATVEDPETTTYTDDTAANGTAYCYQVTVTDAADQTSEPATAGPVTPAEPRLGVTIRDVPDEFTFHTGFPHVITTATTVPRGVDLTDAVLVIEFDPDDPSLPNITVFDDEHPDEAQVETTFLLLEGTAVEGRPVVDYDDAQGTLRASVFIPDQSAPADDRAEDVTISRAPEQVRGLQATGGNNVVRLEWTRSPEPTTTAYRIERATVPVNEPTDDPAACGAGTVGFSTLAEVPQRTGEEIVYTDAAVDNGNAVADNRYCYRVRALRAAQQGLDAADQVGEPSAVESANPDLVAADLTIVRPEAGTVRERASTTVEWTITVPEDGAATTSTVLEYCVDYRAANPLTPPACQDQGGFKRMVITGSPDGTAPSPVAPGDTDTFTAQWVVPSIDQPDGRTGAVRLTTQGDSDINTGIFFR
jgi:putative cell wall-binding protein